MIKTTHQALDQASNRVRGIWLETRIEGETGAEGEGLASWLVRIATIAMAHGDRLESGKYRHAGIKFTFLPMSVQKGDKFSQGFLLQSVERVR